MAILSFKFKNVIASLILSASTASYVLAADSGTVSQKTEPSKENFSVKEKDIPAPKTASNDIQPPDFKELEDDKYIKNLLGEDKHPKTPEAKSEPAIASPPASSKPNNVIDNMLSDGMIKPIEPAKDSLPDINNSPEPVKTELPKTEEGAMAANPDLNPKPASPEQEAISANTPPTDTPIPTEELKPRDVAAADNTLPEQLTDEEKAAYAALKKHLMNFIAGFNNKTTNVAKNEKNEKPKEEPAPAPVQSEPAPATEATPAPVAQAPTPTEEVKATATDALSDLLEPESKAPPVAPDAPKTAADVTPPPAPIAIPPSNPKPAEVAAPVTPPATPEIKPEEKKAEAPVVAATPTTPKVTTPADIVAQLPPVQPKEVKLDEPEEEIAPQKEKPSEADKAYLKLLDKKRDSIPEGKRLSDATRNVIDGVSGTIAPDKKPFKKEPVYIKVERGKTGEEPIEENGVIKNQGKLDASLRKLGKNESYEKSQVKLEEAYKALLVGQTSAAISLYKDVLEKEPKNKDALFGLATAYHKNSQFDQARKIYTELLQKNPSDKEALNNFLVLVAEEAPEDALIELEKLERLNSNFSPIPAQIAMINLRLGNPDKAARYLRRAILLSPENVSYKYNLAITYDKQGKEEQAVQLYHQIIEAARSGAIIPGSIDKLTERLTYLEGKISAKR